MSHLRQLRRQAGSLLAGLGDSPDEVAESLRSAGVQGVPHDNRSCALALYVSAVMGADPRISSILVGQCALQLGMVRPIDRRPAGRLLVQLPKPVRHFVAQFDAHTFPLIVREPPSSPGLVRVVATSTCDDAPLPTGVGLLPTS
jgi:hypothetical protein